VSLDTVALPIVTMLYLSFGYPDLGRFVHLNDGVAAATACVIGLVGITQQIGWWRWWEGRTGPLCISGPRHRHH
jgi:hypothetical protein